MGDVCIRRMVPWQRLLNTAGEFQRDCGRVDVNASSQDQQKVYNLTVAVQVLEPEAVGMPSQLHS